MGFNIREFGYQGGGSGGTSFHMEGNIGNGTKSNIMPGEEGGNIFSNIGRTFKRAGENIGNTAKGLFVSESVNDPSPTQSVLTAGQTGSDAPLPPTDSAPAYANTNTNTSMESELNAFYGETESAAPQNDGREIAPEQNVAQREELSPSVANLAAYQQLRRDYSDAEIQEGASLGVSNEDMLANSKDGKGLIPEDVQQQQQFAELLQHKDALAFQQAMSMNGQIHEDGVSATMTGAKSASAAIQMAYS